MPRMTWRRSPGGVRISIEGGTSKRDAWECLAAPGLAVSVTYDRGARCFGITHIGSGYLVTIQGESGPGLFTRRSDAQRMALRLVRLGDWTRKHADILADEPFREAARAALREGHVAEEERATEALGA